MTDIKNVKIQTRKAVTEEGGAELPAATDLCGVQVAWEFKPSWKSDSSKASRAFGGVKNEFQNNPRRRRKFVLSTSVLQLVQCSPERKTVLKTIMTRVI